MPSLAIDKTCNKLADLTHRSDRQLIPEISAETEITFHRVGGIHSGEDDERSRNLGTILALKVAKNSPLCKKLRTFHCNVSTTTG